MADRGKRFVEMIRQFLRSQAGGGVLTDLPSGVEVDGAIYQLEGEPPPAQGHIIIGPPQT